MKKLTFTEAFVLGSLDMAVGIFIAMIVVTLTNYPHSFGILLFGLFAAASPDIDYIFYLLFKKRKFIYGHRDILHYPFWFVGIGTLLSLLVNETYTLIFFIGSSYHFIHDCTDGSKGVRWFYPFSKKYIAFTKERKRTKLEDTIDITLFVVAVLAALIWL